MSRKNSQQTVGGFAEIVNGLAVAVTVTIIAVGYFSAISNFAGIA